VAYTPRVLSTASLASARELKPVTLTGVDMSTDPAVTLLESAMETGSYFTGDSMEMVLGYRLASDLKVELGDVLVITAARTDSGLASSMFLLSGICNFCNDQLDRYSAFINIGSARDLLQLGEGFHEIAIVLPDADMVGDTSLALWERYTDRENIAEGWTELAPQISSMLDLVNVSMVIMSAILFGLVIFGIVNSLFMSVYERMFELGIMKAVGTRPGTIGYMVIMEAFWLGVISSAIGLAIGLLIIWITSGTGISFGEIEFSGITFSRPIFPVLSPGRAWAYPVFTLLLTTLAGIFPGIHAARQNPAESMRRSL
jgi:ABC-type lipoprotein release transport system permease subunit